MSTAIGGLSNPLYQMLLQQAGAGTSGHTSSPSPMYGGGGSSNSALLMMIIQLLQQRNGGGGGGTTSQNLTGTDKLTGEDLRVDWSGDGNNVFHLDNLEDSRVRISMDDDGRNLLLLDDDIEDSRIAVKNFNGDDRIELYGDASDWERIDDEDGEVRFKHLHDDTEIRIKLDEDDFNWDGDMFTDLDVTFLDE